MDLQFWWMLVKIIIFLPFIILLIYTSGKYGGAKLQNIQKGKYIKILDRTALSKENNLLVIKLGHRGYVMASTNGKIEILVELTKEELEEIENKQAVPEFNSLGELYENTALKKFCKKTRIENVYQKLKYKKEDKYE